MKKVGSIFLLATILLQSCVVYQETSVSIEDACNMGRTKLTTTSNVEYYFENIYLEDNDYYGNYKSGILLIDTTRISSIYLKDNEGKKIYQVVLKLNNKDKVKGYLVGLEDSSIIISDSKNSDYNRQYYPDRYAIEQIEKIKFRRNGKPIISVAIGLGSGFSLGAFMGHQDNKNNSGSSLITDTENVVGTGILIGFIGGLIGVIIGFSYDEVFYIERDDLVIYDIRDDLNKYIIK